jgi:hypothetical protein
MSSEIIRNDPFATLGKQSASAVKSIGKTDVLKSFRVYNGSELFVGIEVLKLNFMAGDGRIFSIHMAFLIRIWRPYLYGEIFFFQQCRQSAHATPDIPGPTKLETETFGINNFDLARQRKVLPCGVLRCG